MSKKRGFTLVELLVVIAVIAILAAILVPAVTKAITTAKLTECRTNMRSILQASAVYGGEEGLEGLMPRFYGTTVDAPHEGRNRSNYNPLYPGNPVIAIHLRNNIIRDYTNFRCPLVNIDWETYFNPEPAQQQTSFWSTYIWWYQHVPFAEETPQRGSGNGSSITAVAEGSEALAITDIKPSYWTNNGTATAPYEHYNAGFGDGSVRLLGKKGYNLNSFAY